MSRCWFHRMGTAPTGAHEMTVIEKCRLLASFSEEPDYITRTFLSAPMHDVHRTLRQWMEPLGMRVWVDDAGNLHGYYPAAIPEAKRILIGSHVDTVPNAGAFDGVLGVVLGIQLVEELAGRKMSFGIEIVAFSEEEGVRFGVPFLGSRALVGTLDSRLLATKDKLGITVAEAIQSFGLQPENVMRAIVNPEEVLGYLEFHIEQGPVLESMNLSLGLVTAIAGQSRLELIFHGQANHAGTTPMNLRSDAVAAASAWVCQVEQTAKATPGLVATVGRFEVTPGAGNVIAGKVRASLDVRSAQDNLRLASVTSLIEDANTICAARKMTVSCTQLLDQQAVFCDSGLVNALAAAMSRVGHQPHRMVSGAGHDAMIMQQRVPVAMLFLRSPGGISHHPSESVLPQDVDAAVHAGLAFLDSLEANHG